jgi:hypothetical protein
MHQMHAILSTIRESDKFTPLTKHTRCAAILAQAPWSEVKGARWLCGISLRVVSPQHLRFFGHDEGSP